MRALLLLVVMVTSWATDDYQERTMLEARLQMGVGYRQAAPAEQAMFDAMLTDQISKLQRLPAPALKVLQAEVQIFVSAGEHRAFGAQHHPSAKWLTAHGYPARMAGHVEICNWTESIKVAKSQPFFLLHEFAHAHHFRNKQLDAVIKAAWQKAKDTGLYKEVTRDHREKKVEAYALKNHHEYFAELSEAYFGENDFFPYNREELKAYDPNGLAMIEQVWGITPAP